MRSGTKLLLESSSQSSKIMGGWCEYLRAPLLPGKNDTKRGVLCGSFNMGAYRKFSDIQWGEFRTSRPPNPPKAPKVNDEEANDARTLDGLGTLGAPTADPQNQPERDAVITAITDGPPARNMQARMPAAKPAKPAKDGQQCASG